MPLPSLDVIDLPIVARKVTLGKSHLAIRLGLAACRESFKTRFYNTAALVNDFTLAQTEQRLPKILAAARQHDLIILDELDLIPFSPSDAQLLFQFCSALHEESRSSSPPILPCLTGRRSSATPAPLSPELTYSLTLRTTPAIAVFLASLRPYVPHMHYGSRAVSKQFHDV